MFHMNEAAKQDKDALSMAQLKLCVLAITKQLHRREEPLTVLDLFEIASAQGLDLAKSDEVLDAYKQISPMAWVESGGSSCFTCVRKGKSYSHVAEHSATMLREAQWRGQAGLSDLGKLFSANHDFMKLLPPITHALSVFSLRQTSTYAKATHNRHAGYERWYIDYMAKIDQATEAVSVKLFDTLYHRQWVSLLKDAFGEKMKLGLEATSFMIDLYKSRGATAVMDCLEFRDVAYISFLVPIALETLELGAIDADQCTDVLINGVRGGLANQELQRALARWLVDSKDKPCFLVKGNCDDGQTEVRRFWLEVLPDTLNASPESAFSPIHGALNARYIEEKIRFDANGVVNRTFEQAREGVRAYLSTTETARLSAVEYFTRINDIEKAVSLCKEFCTGESLKEHLFSIAKTYAAPVTRLRMLSNNFFPFEDENHCTQRIREFGPEFSAEVGRALCQIFERKSTAPRLLQMPGAMPYLRCLAEQDGWDDEKKFGFAHAFRSWPIRKALLIGLDVPSGFYRRLPPGQRGKLISNDLEI